jgi:hypothetical protein
VSGICTIIWVLLASVPFSHIPLEELNICQCKPFLHEKDEFALAQIIIQIPLMESNNLHVGIRDDRDYILIQERMGNIQPEGHKSALKRDRIDKPIDKEGVLLYVSPVAFEQQN